MKRSTMTFGLLPALALASAALGCASSPVAPPRELVEARAAYQTAMSSPGAARVNPEIAGAKQALDEAEKTYANDRSDPAVRDLAYVAARKAYSARAKASTLGAIDDARFARVELIDLQDQRQAMRTGELSNTREQLEAERAKLTSERAKLTSERQARIAAEQKTKEALDKLAGMTAAQTERGLVLTLSGGLLFAKGSSTLLPPAQQKLAAIAKTIAADQRTITVIGHTDATGSDEVNKELSLRRADAVRTYLTGHGVPADRLTTEGAGETQPIGDNKSPEGRALNRRVEIILNNPAP